jgi:hypothetical protein
LNHRNKGIDNTDYPPLRSNDFTFLPIRSISGNVVDIELRTSPGSPISHINNGIPKAFGIRVNISHMDQRSKQVMFPT